MMGVRVAETVYILCALMSIAVAYLLFRGYRRTPGHLLLWSCLCFVALAGNNAILFIDMVVLPDTDIAGPFWRNLFSAIGGSLLLFGLIWELS